VAVEASASAATATAMATGTGTGTAATAAAVAASASSHSTAPSGSVLRQDSGRSYSEKKGARIEVADPSLARVRSRPPRDVKREEKNKDEEEEQQENSWWSSGPPLLLPRRLLSSAQCRSSRAPTVRSSEDKVREAGLEDYVIKAVEEKDRRRKPVRGRVAYEFRGPSAGDRSARAEAARGTEDEAERLQRLLLAEDPGVGSRSGHCSRYFRPPPPSPTTCSTSHLRPHARRR
jgi:hypothetical protein